MGRGMQVHAGPSRTTQGGPQEGLLNGPGSNNTVFGGFIVVLACV